MIEIQDTELKNLFVLDWPELRINPHIKSYKLFNNNDRLILYAYRSPNPNDKAATVINNEIIKLPEYYGEWQLASDREINEYNTRLDARDRAARTKRLINTKEHQDALKKKIEELKAYLNSLTESKGGGQ